MSASQVIAVTVRTKGKMSIGQVFLTRKHGANKGGGNDKSFNYSITFLIQMFDLYSDKSLQKNKKRQHGFGICRKLADFPLR
jgi:hypothetical protein